MNEFIESSKIEVAPAVRRATTYPKARLMSEQLLVGIINKLIDKESFVISKPTAAGYLDTSKPFEFNIYGYYFVIDPVSAIIGDGPDQIYAYIELEKGDNFTELKGQDEKPTGSETLYYKGIHFVLSELEIPTNAKSLLLLKKSTVLTDHYEIPADSLIKFDESSLDVSVDGGEIKE